VRFFALILMAPTYRTLLLAALLVAAHAASDAAKPEEGECLSALQHAPKHASKHHHNAHKEHKAFTQSMCQGAWCDALSSFCSLFDSNDPWEMQKAFDKYSEYASDDEGIKIAVTKDHYYEMYHGNVGRKLSEYLPQKLFAWHFDDDFKTTHHKHGQEVTIARTGTITFNLGWWRRQMFWNNVVKSLPDGEKFPFSKVEEFDDCTDCPAKMVFKLKKGGLDGTSKGWKVVDLALVKLA